MPFDWERIYYALLHVIKILFDLDTEERRQQVEYVLVQRVGCQLVQVVAECPTQ